MKTKNQKKISKSASGNTKPSMTFQEAIDMGEYDPDYLANFPQWHTFPKHTQLQHIRHALDNRRKQLLTQWAEINNVLDFRTKPELQSALKNIEQQLKSLEQDRERLY